MALHEKNRVVKDSARLTLARVGVLAVNFFKNIILAKIMTPASFGVLNIISLFVDYNSFAHFGFRQAVMREAPAEIGRGHAEGARRIINSAFTANMLLSLVVTVVLVIVAVAGYRHDRQLMLAYITSGIVFSLVTVYALYETRATIYSNFLFISKLRFIYAVTLCAFMTAAILIGGVEGGFIAFVITNLLILIYCFLKMGLGYSPSLDIADLKRLWKVGFPIFMGGIVWSFFISSDRLLLVSQITLVGKEQYGLYTFAVILLSIFYAISSDTGSVVYRYNLVIYGRTGDAADLFPSISKSSLFIGYIFPYIIGQIFILIDPFLSLIFPRYIQAAPLVKIMSPAFFCLMCGIYHTTLMNTLNKQNLHLYIRVIFLAGLVLSITIMIRAGCGIAAISYAKAMAWSAYSIFIILLTTRYVVSRRKDQLMYVAELFLPATATALLLCLFSAAHLKWVAGSVILTALYIPVLAMANKRLRLVDVVKEIMSQKKLAEASEEDYEYS